MSHPLRFGLVGAGRIAESYVQAFEGCEYASIVAVADVRPEAAFALAGRLGCPAFPSHAAMAAAGRLDAVLVCTPPVTHPDVAIHFLRRRVHVLCEKPLSIDSHSARLMAQAARRTGAVLAMASKFRYVKDVVHARSLVASGVLGEIVQAENSFTAQTDMSARWNCEPALSGGGVLIDNGTHSVDLMRCFLGPLVEVLSVEGPRSQGLAVEETVHLLVRNAGGALGSIDLSWSLAKQAQSYLTLYGTEGILHLGWRESRYRRTGSDSWIPFGTGYDKVQAFRAQIENFVRAIEGEEELRISMADALASVEVVEAAYRALHGRRWTAVNDADAANPADVADVADRLRRRRQARILSLVADERR